MCYSSPLQISDMVLIDLFNLAVFRELDSQLISCIHV